MKVNLTYSGFSIVVSDNCITVRNSYKTASRRLVKQVLQYVATQAPNNVTRNRSMFSLCNEWIAHTHLYRLGIARSHTRDVDIEYPQSALHAIAWTIIGTF